MRRHVVCAALGALLAVPGAARAAGPSVLGAGIPCVSQPDGVRFCAGSTVPAPPALATPELIDGAVIDANVTLPPAGVPAPYPLVIIGHGWGGHKQPLDSREAPWLPTAHELARNGYAVLNATDRGFGDSCGSTQSRVANPQCAQGWIKLMDLRAEVRDAQQMAGELVDEGWVQPTRIGAIGESYGGGESLMLATLKDAFSTPRRAAWCRGPAPRAPTCRSPPPPRPSRGRT